MIVTVQVDNSHEVGTRVVKVVLCSVYSRSVFLDCNTMYDLREILTEVI